MSDRWADLRRLEAEASRGPWFFDSYDRVMSEPKCRETREWSEAMLPKGEAEAQQLTDEDWKRLAAQEPRHTVCHVKKDAQGGRDAEFVVAARNAVPELLVERDEMWAALFEVWKHGSRGETDEGISVSYLVEKALGKFREGSGW